LSKEAPFKAYLIVTFLAKWASFVYISAFLNAIYNLQEAILPFISNFWLYL